jgi:hypothetical protein
MKSHVVEALVAGSAEVNAEKETMSRIAKIILTAIEASREVKLIDVPLEPIKGEPAKVRLGLESNGEVVVGNQHRRKKETIVLEITIGSVTYSDGDSLPLKYVPGVFAQLDTIINDVREKFPHAGRTLDFLIATGERKLYPPPPTVTEL